MNSNKLSRAGSIKIEWKAPPTLNLIAFFAPLALAKSTAIANESLSPLMITC